VETSPARSVPSTDAPGDNHTPRRTEPPGRAGYHTTDTTPAVMFADRPGPRTRFPRQSAGEPPREREPNSRAGEMRRGSSCRAAPRRDRLRCCRTSRRRPSSHRARISRSDRADAARSAVVPRISEGRDRNGERCETPRPRCCTPALISAASSSSREMKSVSCAAAQPGPDLEVEAARRTRVIDGARPRAGRIVTPGAARAAPAGRSSRSGPALRRARSRAAT